MRVTEERRHGCLFHLDSGTPLERHHAPKRRALGTLTQGLTSYSTTRYQVAISPI
jgi:hypothetical protein